MEFLPNGMSKNVINDITNNYILKVNSRDRNIINEPNPFNFKIRFNQVDNKYTIYYEKGYWGSGNKFINYNTSPPTNWKSTEDGRFSKTYYINNGAIIEDRLEAISDLNVTEIVAPRYIPENEVGYKINGIEAMSNPRRKSSIYLRGIDSASIKYIVDDNNQFSDNKSGSLVEICDSYLKKFYLVSTSNMSKLTDNIKKNYGLYNNYFTDTLVLNNKLYKISDISGTQGVVYLENNGLNADLDFIKSSILFPKYYSDTIWYQPKDSQFKNLSMTKNLDFTGQITIDQSGESLITSELVKDSIIEVEEITSFTGPTIRYHYFQISKVVFLLDFVKTAEYKNTVFNSNNNTILISNLPKPWFNFLLNFDSISNNNKITISNASNADNNKEFTVLKVENQHNVNNNLLIYIDNESGTKDLVSEEGDVNIKISKQISKIFPNVNLTKDELEELDKYLAGGQKSVDNSPNDYTDVKVTMDGKWIYMSNSQTVPNVTSTSSLVAVKLNHLKHGARDLLNEKLFYLGLEPITPPRSLITNNKLNNVIGVFYPSTQSKNYIYLTGRNKQSYHSNNLQNINNLDFKLYFMNGDLVGDNMKNFSLDYLEQDCKQINLTFQVEQVKKF